MTVTHWDRANRYAEAVVGSDVPACELVRLACQRHLDDLERHDSDDDFPFEPNPERANRVCRFIEKLPHVKGRWAKAKEKIALEDWQCFLICVPFGWFRKADGLRRYRKVYAEIARKNAKSTTSAGVGNYMFCADDEHGAEVYSGATTEKQAWEVFGPARLMVDRTPALQQAAGITVNAKNMHRVANASKFEPLIGNPGDGASPSFAIVDEYHEHATEAQYDTMVTGMGAREEPMVWVITTAGDNTAGPCYALRGEVEDVLRGSVENDELFGIIYTIDEDDDWTSEEALRKANPNFDVSVSNDFLRSQQREAINSPRKQSTFKTKHLNVWVGAAAPYFNLEKWQKLADSSLRREDFVGVPCYKGLDLASKLDLCADVSVFERVEEDGQSHFYVFGSYYCPEERTIDPDCRHYAGWAADGHLVATPGNVTDYDAIEDGIMDEAEAFSLVQLGYDPWNATQMATHLTNAGIECVEVHQTTKNLSDAMKWVEALIVDGRIHHDGNPVLSWAIGNVTAQVDRNDNVFPRKERPEKKIDPAVALIMAMGRAIADDAHGQSVYEGRGLVTL